MLYWNCFSTPSKRLAMWLHTVRRLDSCLVSAKYIFASTILPPSFKLSSIGKCLKSLLSVPYLPVTSTFLALMVIFTPLGTLIVSDWQRVFIAARGSGAAAAVQGQEVAH